MNPTAPHPARLVLLAGTVYFLLVFSAGFVLGVVRTLWVVPAVGERWAELLEIPLMLGVIYLAARWVARRFEWRARPARWAAGAGLLALTLLLTAELGLVLQLQGLTFQEYLASRDPVSGSAYAASLVVYAAMPWILARRTHRQPGGSSPNTV